MLWKDLGLAAHGLSATVQCLVPLEEGMSLSRQMTARVRTYQMSGTIVCSTYLDIPKLLVKDENGEEGFHIFHPTAIVILKEP